ncbi:MAG: long-chain fatty acid--CoA ligase [Actinomycetota bacterium]|nr:long-chain fatty acid--CoA ligase [Actinomycetota bacterium]
MTTRMGERVHDRTSRFTSDTIVDAFWEQVGRFANRSALRYHRNGDWQALSWSDYGDLVKEVAAGLVALGIEPGDKVAVLAGNRVEWHAADMAALSVGGVTVPLYQTSSPEQVAYTLAHSGARVCVVDDADQVAKLVQVRAEVPALERIIVIDPLDGAPVDAPDDAVRWDELRERGRRALADAPALVAERARAVRPADLATLVYTSGTTGPPKGVMITHDNIAWTLRSVIPVVDTGPDDRYISFLPLSHIAERMTSHLGQIAVGGETWFARSLVGVADDLKDCRPTVFLAVPRVWEKLHDAIVERTGNLSGPQRMLIARYVAAGRRVVDHDQDRATLWPHQRAEHRLLDRLVGAKLRHELGLDRARLLGTAAAPIDPGLLRWFHAIGLPILEIYGQTEDCGPATINPPERIRIGTVGPAIPGLSLRVADDGEILVKGGSVCAGYYHDPEATAELIDAEGWMHTGDMGRVDPDGYLRIEGRKKDLIITAAGHNVAPQHLETQLKSEPLISQAVVVGDGRRYLTALLALDPAELGAWAEEHGKLADEEALTTDPQLRDEVAAAVERVNALNARSEGIKKFRILPHELTATEGELTPTLKVKRGVVIERYADAVEEMYIEGG